MPVLDQHSGRPGLKVRRFFAEAASRAEIETVWTVFLLRRLGDLEGRGQSFDPRNALSLASTYLAVASGFEQVNPGA